jgi:hypothetical protein
MTGTTYLEILLESQSQGVLGNTNLVPLYVQ